MGYKIDLVPDKIGNVGNGVKFERIRRITGYLVGTLDRFNNAKRAEVGDRIPSEAKHEDDPLYYNAHRDSPRPVASSTSPLPK